MERKGNPMAGDDDQVRAKKNERKKLTDARHAQARPNFTLPIFDFSAKWKEFVRDRMYDDKMGRNDLMCRPYLDGWIEIYYYVDDRNHLYLDFYGYDSFSSYETDMRFCTHYSMDKLAEILRDTFVEKYTQGIMQHRDEVYVGQAEFVIH